MIEIEIVHIGSRAASLQKSRYLNNTPMDSLPVNIDTLKAT